jgi:hypothetical protein
LIFEIFFEGGINSETGITGSSWLKAAAKNNK